MRVSGSVWQVQGSVNGEPIVVVIKIPRANKSDIIMLLSFGEQWRSRLAVLRRGTVLTAIGRVKSFTVDGQSLDDCEIVFN
jgi:hypothetical protein